MKDYRIEFIINNKEFRSYVNGLVDKFISKKNKKVLSSVLNLPSLTMDRTNLKEQSMEIVLHFNTLKFIDFLSKIEAEKVNMSNEVSAALKRYRAALAEKSMTFSELIRYDFTSIHNLLLEATINLEKISPEELLGVKQILATIYKILIVSKTDPKFEVTDEVIDEVYTAICHFEYLYDSYLYTSDDIKISVFIDESEKVCHPYPVLESDSVTYLSIVRFIIAKITEEIKEVCEDRGLDMMDVIHCNNILASDILNLTKDIIKISLYKEVRSACV